MDKRIQIAAAVLAAAMLAGCAEGLGGGSYRREDARREFEQTVTWIEPLAARFPDRPEILRLQGVAYYKLAELERAGATTAADAPGERTAHWRAALQWLRKTHAVFINMRDRKLLAPADAGVPDELAAEIATGEAAAGEP